MTVTKAVDLTNGGRRPPTLLGILDAILKETKEKNHKTILLVCHGMTIDDNPRGLLMKIAPDSQIDADDTFLKALIKASKVLRARDTVLKFLGSSDRAKDVEVKLKNLRDTFKIHFPDVSKSELDGLTSLDGADKWLQAKFKEWTEVFTPQGQSRTVSMTRFMEILKKRNEVCDLMLSRLEIRACNLGRNLNALSTVADFFGVKEATAPLVSTIFGNVNPHIFDQRHFDLWARTRAPSLTGADDPIPGRRVLAVRGASGWTGAKGGNVTAALAIWANAQDMVARDRAAVSQFVETFVGVKGFHGTSFPIMGFDCARNGTTPPQGSQEQVLPAGRRSGISRHHQERQAADHHAGRAADDRQLLTTSCILVTCSRSLAVSRKVSRASYRALNRKRLKTCNRASFTPGLCLAIARRRAIMPPDRAMSRRVNRRKFLQASAALGAAGLFINPLSAAEQAPRPNDRIRVGIVGVAGQGTYNLNEVDKTGLAEIVALCDVDTNRAAPIRQRFPNARFYDDYRRLVEHKDLQAVVIATPDHHHAFAALAAIRARKHVYCEKPLAHSVQEVRLMMEAAAREKVVTQMGTQIHALDNYRRCVEIVQAGSLGPIRRVKVWCATQLRPGIRVKDAQPAPKGLNYDLWLGPAPQQGYPPFRTGNDASVHFHWRWWWDFGGGVLADMACHFMDLPHWALNLRHPTSVAATGRITYKGDNDMPDKMQVDYEYPARGDLPAVSLTWYHGVNGPDLEGKVTYDGYPSGVLFEGEHGTLIANYNQHRLIREPRGFERPAQSIAASVGHHREWLQAIRTGAATTCNFDYSGALAETVLLGNVAYRAGGKFTYDARTGRVTGNANADRYLRREYRKACPQVIGPAAVQIADVLRFARDVEGVARAVAGYHLKRLGVESIHRLHGAARVVEIAAQRIERAEQ
jgi:predicted dehydrogenase